MRRRKPIRNIKPILSDIRHKEEKYDVPPRKIQASRLSRFRPKGEIKLGEHKVNAERDRKLRTLAAAGASLVIVVFVWWAGSGVVARADLRNRYAASRENLWELLQSPGSSSTDQVVSLNRNGGLEFPFINQFNAATRDINELGGSVTDLSSAMVDFSGNWITDFFGGNGGDLLANVSNIKDDLSSIVSSNRLFIDESNPSASGSVSESVNLESKLLLFQNGADGLFSLLSATSSHILLVFTDPTDSLRPSGGKISSYADLTISGGQESSLAVQSISVPDSEPGKKILPPPELRGVEKTWSAGEANWFFDFPTSAEKIISFMQSSGVYSGSGTKFSGVILVNNQALQQMIAAVNPSLLPDSGRSVVDSTYLKTALPEVFKEIASSAPLVQQDLMGAIEGGLSDKNIMMFFTDNRLQSFVSSFGYDGGVYSVPYNFAGDYLGVTNITPQAARHGTVLSDHVILKSQVDQSGTVSDNLTIEDSYSNPAGWYHDYRRTLVRIFTLPTSALISADGMSNPVFENLGQYRAGYSTDPTLSTIENSVVPSGVTGVSEESESGMRAYGAWLNGYVGEMDTLNMNYVSGSMTISDGQKFYFVFDKQSGVNQTLDYLVQAPLGYGWEEAPGESPVYSFHSSSLAPRTIIELTLVKK